MAQRADETVTVRMPKGKAAEIKAATGIPFSTLCRYIMLALLERKKAERAAQQSDIAGEIRDIVNEQLGATDAKPASNS